MLGRGAEAWMWEHRPSDFQGQLPLSELRWRSRAQLIYLIFDIGLHPGVCGSLRRVTVAMCVGTSAPDMVFDFVTFVTIHFRTWPGIFHAVKVFLDNGNFSPPGPVPESSSCVRCSSLARIHWNKSRISSDEEGSAGRCLRKHSLVF